ncbi:alpha/beta fold hydrolase [Rhodoligotrophos defluvii]|uniref:alpha/beta fold hydrolase n=1 Tax=Rhodoligotrophos defluvii TaxID=2561934 RepID=UPI0010C9362D|nr:alpha/beta hydrolase [Rhodoligotrophos defluvii]
MASAWQLNRRVTVEGVEIAYEVFGEGKPVVLVHGFPGNSYIWRNIVPTLAQTHRVHVYDLPGQGASEQREGMDVSDPMQSRVLRSLLEHWKLERPAGIFHDIGNTYGMSAYYFEGCRFDRMALISAAMMLPCVTAATKHAQKYIEAYRTMPYALYELIATARIRSTTHRPLSEEAFEAYMKPWRGEKGQAMWYNRVAQIADEHIARLEAALGPTDVPVRIIWGTEDTWIPVDQAARLQRYIRNADVHLVEGGGHFLMEDAPEEVTRLLVDFLQR